MVELTSDRVAMLADFGESWVKPGGAQITVLFDEQQQDTTDATYRGFIRAQTSDLADIKERDTMIRLATGIEYAVSKIEAEEVSGFSTLHMMRV